MMPEFPSLPEPDGQGRKTRQATEDVLFGFGAAEGKWTRIAVPQIAKKAQDATRAENEKRFSGLHVFTWV